MNFFFKNTNDPLLRRLYTQYLKPEMEKGNIGSSLSLPLLMDNNILYTFIYVESGGKEMLKNKPYKIYYFPFINEPMDLSIIITKYSPYERFFNYMCVYH